MKIILKIIGLALILIIPNLISGQKSVSERKISFGFSFGKSYPIGKFASQDINDPQAGTASPGRNARLQLKYDLNKLYYVSGIFGLDGTFSPIYQEINANRFPDFRVDNQGSQNDLFASGYVLLGIGRHLHINTENNFFWDVNFHVGYSVSTTPLDALLYQHLSDNNIRILSERSINHSIGFMLGTDANYMLSKYFGTHFSVNYFGSNIGRNDVVFTFRDGSQISETKDFGYGHILQVRIGVFVKL
ncbi:MAG: hypothetical protein IPM42_03285 [Saprospiraceae bacterium]|nr:hypothetical protein [Saprospiraceae bacterium]